MKNLFYLSIFVVLIFTLSPLVIQNAHASSFTAIRNGDWNVDTTWDGMAIPTPFDAVVIPNGITVTIPSGLTMTDEKGHIIIYPGGTLINNGDIVVHNAVINIDGILNNNGVITMGIINTSGHVPSQVIGQIFIESGGKLFNNELGTIHNDNTGQITLSGGSPSNPNLVGEISNVGIIKNDGVITIFGQIINGDTLSNSGEIDNAGTITNVKSSTKIGLIDNSGTINNFIPGSLISGGTILLSDASTIKNTGDIINNGATITNRDGSIITNMKTITNIGGTITNYCPSIIDPMTVSAGNAIVDIPCPSPPITLDAQLLAWIAMISTVVFVTVWGLLSTNPFRKN